MGVEFVALFVLALPHMVGAVFLGWWILPASAKHELRGWFRDDGGSDRPVGPPSAPSGQGGRSTVPLPDAAPAAVRMREPGRLNDGRPVRRRPLRPVEPDPHREPQPR